jgi:hypothetical protein
MNWSSGTSTAGPSSVVILDVETANVAAGVYLVEAAILEPATGVTIARDFAVVVKD